MDNTDDLRGALESAFDGADTPAVDTTPAVDSTPAVETSPSDATAAQRARDEAGRFAKSRQEQGPAPKLDGPQVTAATVAPAATPQVTTPQAPSSWKKEAAAVWAKIDSGEPITPAELKLFRDEAARREGDYHKGVEGWKGHAKTGQAYEQALAPYQETLKTLGVDGVTAVTELMKADHVLRHAPQSVKAQKLMELAQVYGIDLRQQFTPEVARYERELFETKEQLKAIQTASAESTNQSLNSDIERFAAAPGHELFEEVRGHMASLLSGGVAKDLEDAYQQAVFANPQTRSTLLEQQRRAAAADAQAQRARAAAGSVRGSSPASGSTSPAVNSVRDAVSAAFDAHS